MHIPLKHGKENHQDHESLKDLSSVRLGILLPERSMDDILDSGGEESGRGDEDCPEKLV
jgi:hypothetical protein